MSDLKDAIRKREAAIEKAVASKRQQETDMTKLIESLKRDISDHQGIVKELVGESRTLEDSISSQAAVLMKMRRTIDAHEAQMGNELAQLQRDKTALSTEKKQFEDRIQVQNEKISMRIKVADRHEQAAKKSREHVETLINYNEGVLVKLEKTRNQTFSDRADLDNDRTLWLAEKKELMDENKNLKATTSKVEKLTKDLESRLQKLISKENAITKREGELKAKEDKSKENELNLTLREAHVDRLERKVDALIQIHKLNEQIN